MRGVNGDPCFRVDSRGNDFQCKFAQWDRVERKAQIRKLSRETPRTRRPKNWNGHHRIPQFRHKLSDTWNFSGIDAIIGILCAYSTTPDKAEQSGSPRSRGELNAPRHLGFALHGAHERLGSTWTLIIRVTSLETCLSNAIRAIAGCSASPHLASQPYATRT